jgi:hypothetical protein
MVSPRRGAAIARRRIGGGAISAVRRSGQSQARQVRLAGLAHADIGVDPQVEAGADRQVEAGADGHSVRAEDKARVVRPD